MNNLSIPGLVMVAAISSALIGCAGLGPRNAYKPVADSMGPDKVLKCAANAAYFQEKGKNENTDFGSKYVKPYSTEKWETARLMQQFYYNIAQNYPEQSRDKLYNTYNQSSYFTKEIADECQKGFDSAPQNLKNDAFHDTPFFSDPQKISMVCTAAGDSIRNLESAALYFKRGVAMSRDMQRAFGTCVNSSSTKRIRDFIVIHDLGGKDVRFMGSFRSEGKLYFAELTQFDKYYNVSYFPDLKK
jgi:hypothetical protein